MNDKQTAYIATVPEKSRKLMERAIEGRTSPRQCIKAKCLSCCNFDRAQAAACNVQVCPLYEVNPYRKTNGADDEEDNPSF